MSTPRCFLVRHGETEWSRSGRHTSYTEIGLTEDGEKRVQATGKALVGDDRLIVPGRLARIYVSPRLRAQRTLELLQLGCRHTYPWRDQGKQQVTGNRRDTIEAEPERSDARIIVTDDIREWEYGEYEGITSHEIRERRDEQGLPAPWDIWRDGCPGGESPAAVCERLDRLIAEIKNEFHGPAMMKKAEGESTNESRQAPDVLVVAHGHILRAFATRWVGKPLTTTSLLMEAGGVGTLSYEHHNLQEPAILLGGSFAVSTS